MPRAALIVALLACQACAGGSARVPSGAGPNGAPPTQATIFSGPNLPTVRADRPRISVRTINAPAADVRSVVRQVYADYEVPLTIDDPATQQLGNAGFNKTRRFAGRPMAELLNCGSSMTGPNAASYRIYMSLLTTVVAEGADRTTVSVILSAGARDMSSGATADRLVCGTTGELEQLMLARINALAVR